MSLSRADEVVPTGPPVGIRALGFRGIVLSIQFFFLLLAADNSPAFGGSWSAYLVPFEVYILLFLIATVVEGVVAPVGGLSDRIPRFSWNARIQLSLPEEDKPGVLTNYAFWFGVFTIVSALGGILILKYAGIATVAVSGQARINTLAYVIVFVAPTEEFFFRAVLPRRIGWIGGSVLAFGLYHVAAYTAEVGTFSVDTVSELFLAMAIGFLLWPVYDARKPSGERRFGLGGTIPLHMVYDLFQYGVIGGFALGLLSVTPLGLLHP